MIEVSAVATASARPTWTERDIGRGRVAAGPRGPFRPYGLGADGLGGVRSGLLRGRGQPLELLRDRLGDRVHVLHRVVVGEQAEVDGAVVAHDRDRQGMVGR